MSNSAMVEYTLISPHRTSPRVYPISKITIHHMAGNMTIEQCCRLFQTREASSNYCIDNSCRVGMPCEEKDRAWCSANYDNDHRAINIELANDGGAPDWHVSDAVIEKCIELCVDICQRNGIEKLVFTGDRTGNLTQHNYFCATACPGPYLKTKFPYIAEEVNKRLQGGSGNLFKLRIGYASSGDITTFKRMLDSMGISYKETGGYITTGIMNEAQKNAITAKARELVVPCIVTELSPSPIPEPTPEPEPEPTDEYKELYEELQVEYAELETKYLVALKAIKDAIEVLKGVL